MMLSTQIQIIRLSLNNSIFNNNFIKSYCKGLRAAYVTSKLMCNTQEENYLPRD